MEWRRKGGLILDAGGVMAAADTARKDVMVCWFGRFKACDALIWTLCQQDVTFVGECE